MIESILKYSEFSCGIILFLFAVIQITYKNRDFINYNLAGIFFSLSYVILTLWAFKSGIMLHIPWLLYTDMTAAFAIGPFVYFYMKTVLGLKSKSRTTYLLHFIPAITVYCTIVLSNIVDGSLVRYYLHFPGKYPAYNMNFLTR